MSKKCPICQDTINPGDETMVCNLCGAVYHTQCWNFNGKCAEYGCTSTFATPSVEEGVTGAAALAATMAEAGSGSTHTNNMSFGNNSAANDPFGIDIIEVNEYGQPPVSGGEKPREYKAPPEDKQHGFCGKCGKKIVKGAKFCKACGAKVE